MAGIKDYSTTAANNTTIGSISTAEGMLPSSINNCFRGLGAEIREWVTMKMLEFLQNLCFLEPS